MIPSCFNLQFPTVKTQEEIDLFPTTLQQSNVSVEILIELLIFQAMNLHLWLDFGASHVWHRRELTVLTYVPFYPMNIPWLFLWYPHEILCMEEILHHQKDGWKPLNNDINHLSTDAGFLPQEFIPFSWTGGILAGCTVCNSGTVAGDPGHEWREDHPTDREKSHLYMGYRALVNCKLT